jgi:hypothetical protein
LDVVGCLEVPNAIDLALDVGNCDVSECLEVLVAGRLTGRSISEDLICVFVEGLVALIADRVGLLLELGLRQRLAAIIAAGRKPRAG